MKDRTIIYVSSNTESTEFERQTRLTLLENCKDMRIISVTQKAIPPDLMGKNEKNIVVGEVGASGFNFCRQVLIGLRNADTPVVVSAESDCIYPPDYFTFVPPELHIPYRNTNVFVQKYGQDFVCQKKEGSTFAQVIGREFYMHRLIHLFRNQPDWSISMKNFPKEIGKVLFREFAYFESANPCVSFKTGNGMRKHSHSTEVPVYELPYWGPIKDLRKRYGA